MVEKINPSTNPIPRAPRKKITFVAQDQEKNSSPNKESIQSTMLPEERETLKKNLKQMLEAKLGGQTEARLPKKDKATLERERAETLEKQERLQAEAAAQIAAFQAALPNMAVAAGAPPPPPPPPPVGLVVKAKSAADESEKKEEKGEWQPAKARATTKPAGAPRITIEAIEGMAAKLKKPRNIKSVTPPAPAEPQKGNWGITLKPKASQNHDITQKQEKKEDDLSAALSGIAAGDLFKSKRRVKTPPKK